MDIMGIVFTKKLSGSEKTLFIIIPKDVKESYKLVKGMCFQITLMKAQEDE